MSRLDAYKPNLKKASQLFQSASGVIKKVAGAAKTGYKKLERREELKKKGSIYTYDRVGNQLIRRKKTKAELDRDSRP